MSTNYLFILTIFMFTLAAESTSCGDGWAAYKDETCVKNFNKFLTYSEAKDYCLGLDQSSLVMIKDTGMQGFLINFTRDIYENLWIGAKFDKPSQMFKWDDGSHLKYTNWVEGSPQNVTRSDICIELITSNTILASYSESRWIDVSCKKRNLVMCQKPLEWTLQDAIKEIKRIRREHEIAMTAAETERNILTKRLQQTEDQLQLVSSRVVPVGSIYIEYYNQPSPGILWPELTWEDITSAYGGLFFRTSGGGSESWGITQSECAPRITQMEYAEKKDGSYPTPNSLPANGWSDYGKAGGFFTGGELWIEALRFNTAGCEVRPRNQAIRIWKRTA